MGLQEDKDMILLQQQKWNWRTRTGKAKHRNVIREGMGRKRWDRKDRDANEASERSGSERKRI